MNSNKATCIDGFNVFLFKKACHKIRVDIVEAIRMIFDDSKMYRPINCTNLTVVPKTSDAASAAQPRISCCLKYSLIGSRRWLDQLLVVHKLISSLEESY